MLCACQPVRRLRAGAGKNIAAPLVLLALERRQKRLLTSERPQTDGRDALPSSV